MICAHCNQELEDNAEFCANCGNSVTPAQTKFFEPDPEGVKLAAEPWCALEGQEKTFPLNGQELKIPANLDLFNAYRKKFWTMAKYCSDKAAEEYVKSIHDFDTFMELFPKVYNTHLDLMIEKAIDVLISDNIFSVSAEMLKEIHLDAFHLAIEDYNVMEESRQLTVQENTKLNRGLQGLAGAFIGTQSSFGQGLFEGMTDGLVEETSQVNAEQKAELYGRINKVVLLNRIFSDYWHVYAAMIMALNNVGKGIWFFDTEASQENNNIFKNLSNPNFPQDKIIPILFDMIGKEPYRAEIYHFLENKYGKTDEVMSIVDYFAPDEDTSAIYTAEDFPKEEVPVVALTETAQTEENVPQTDETENKKKGFFSFGGRLDGEKVKKSLLIGAGIAVTGAALGGIFGGGSSSKQSSSNESLWGTGMCPYGKPEREYNRNAPDFARINCYSCPLRTRCGGH